MTPFEAQLIATLDGFAWMTLSALLFWVTGSQWAPLAVSPDLLPVAMGISQKYGRKP